jgi:hypothetical protein
MRVSVKGPAGSALEVRILDPRRADVLSRATAGPGAEARAEFSNCGHGAVEVEVSSGSGPAGFEAAIERP